MERISIGLHPLLVGATGIQLNYKKAPFSCEVKIPDLRVALDWSLSWEELPWPKIDIEKITINRPSVSIQMPQPRKEGDWTVWLKKIPALKEIEVNDLKGRLEIGKTHWKLAPGARVVASFFPDQGGKIEYQIKELQGGWTSKGLKFKTGSRGSFELSDLPDRPKWKGSLTLSNGNLLSQAGKLVEVSGTFGLLYQDRLLEISASAARIQELDWRKKNISFAGKGKLVCSGTIQHKGSAPTVWVISGIHFQLDDLDFDFQHRNQWIKGRAEGQIRLRGPLLTPMINARLSTRQTEMDLPPVFTREMETEMEVQGKFPVLSFPMVRGRAAQSDWHLAAGPLSVINPETRLTANMNMNSRQIYLQDIDLRTENWGPLSGSLLFDLTKGPAPQGKVRSQNFPLLRFLLHFFPRVVEPFPEEIPCQGTLEWSRETAASPFDFLLSMVPVPFVFDIPDTDWEGEGLKTRIESQGKWFFRDRKVQVTLNTFLSEGRLSRTPWFFTFDENPLWGRFEGTVEWRKPAGSVIGSLGFRHDPLGEIKVSGEWPFGSSPRSFSGSLEMKNLPLQKGFPLLVGMPLAEDHPFWEKVSLQGLLNARLSVLKKEATYDLRGRVIGSGINFNIQDSAFSFQKGDLDLPFHLSSMDIDPGKSLLTESGFLQVENLHGPRINLDELHFSILAGTNQFEIPDKIAVPLWGGQMIVNSFKLSNRGRDFKMDLALSLRDLDLVQIFPGQEIAGSLQGDLEPIRIDKEKARIGGTLKADVFEGQVEGKNLAVIRPFSPERAIQGELFFSHLNLEPITRHFSFGKITGFVQGQVTNLVVRDNLPEQFDLRFNTQEVPGVSKTINIKAIENIGIFGTGWGDLDALRKGINRFISEYSYREIGLSCSLKEDLFHLNGTIFENGIEYLVRKPNWFGIDIINKNPDNEILFSDILSRIRSIGKKPQGGTGDEIE